MKLQLRTLDLKLGLFVLALLIALTSLWYSNNLVQRLRDREFAGMAIWAGAREEVARAAMANPYESEFQTLDTLLDPDSPDTRRMREALNWAGSMPMGDHIEFFFDVISNYYPDVPAIITDSLDEPLIWHNIDLPETGPLAPEDSQLLNRQIRRMAGMRAPIPIKVAYLDPEQQLSQRVYYGESSIIRELRIYPMLQLFFVSLFVLVGYMGFSHVRRNEQSNLWVGMAREAAHQLGTPISSLMGWLEIMRSAPGGDQGVLDEMDRDLQRLSLVTQRFNAIGSAPKLKPQSPIAAISSTAEYIRRRMPQRAITLTADTAEVGQVALNAELFAWVIENMLKNALDAMDKEEGRITLSVRRQERRICIECTDNGRGIERRNWNDIFKPGYTTRKRGWGLGLSLAKRIVEEYHGGSLELAESAPGRGSTFRILLPAIPTRP
ncbi:MAG: HAMP domain-containing sensor histidine kinase [Bacteroidota bacterium]|nr:HAMP domain-containing sensor histidine kinase [Bacteroidota bacterium]